MQSTSSMYMDISPPYLAGPQRLPEGTQGPSTYTLYSNAVEQLTMQGALQNLLFIYLKVEFLLFSVYLSPSISYLL